MPMRLDSLTRYVVFDENGAWVMTTTLDVLNWVFNIHSDACARIERETRDFNPCELFANNRPYANRWNKLVVRRASDGAQD